MSTLHPITPTALCRKIPTPFGMTAYTSGYDPSVPERGPYHPDLTAEERRYSVLFSVFPNLTLSIVPNVTLYLIVRPIDADSVGVRWGLAGTLDDPELMAPQSVIWASSAPSWAVLDPRLPHHPKGPQS